MYTDMVHNVPQYMYVHCDMYLHVFDALCDMMHLPTGYLSYMYMYIKLWK